MTLSTLTRRVGLKRTGRLSRRTGLRRAPAARSRPRQTGPSRDVKLAVLSRDGWQCVPQVACKGAPPRLLVAHHRVNRGMGGSTAPWVNEPVNLLACCVSCNSALEDRTRPEHYEQGWKVHRGTDPGMIPVRYPDGVLRFLDGRDGGSSVVETALLAAFAAALAVGAFALLDHVLTVAMAGRCAP